MLTYEQAKEIGRDACIERLGRDFVTKYRDNSSSAFGDRGDHIYCFIGVSDKPAPKMTDGLVLSSDTQFPFIARCTVDYVDGHINFLECKLPS